MQKQKALNYILSGVVLYLTVVACGDSSTTGSSIPVITMLGTSPVEVMQNVPYVDAGATANDTEDGNITADIATANLVDETLVGSYTVTYSVVDSSGQVANDQVRTVNVVSNFSPVITLIGPPSFNAILNSTYFDDGATAADAEDGDITANIIIGGDVVDTSVLGSTYLVTYDVNDSAGAPATKVTRTVNVVPATDGGPA